MSLNSQLSTFFFLVFFLWSSTALGKPNPEIAEVQRMLNTLGFGSGEVDGVYGSATRKALEKFYLSIGGTYDGTVDGSEIADLGNALEKHLEIRRKNWMNLPSGFNKSDLSIAPALIPYYHSTMARTYADIDGDGNVDLFGVRQLWSWHKVTKEEILRKGSRASFFKLDPVSNTWKVQPTPKINNPEDGCIHPRASIAGDFNGDKRVDFFVACHGVDLPPYPREANDIYIQNDDGSFTISKPWSEIGFYHSVASADFNQDGILDVVVTNNMAGKGKSKAVLRVYLNDGTGRFTYSSKYSPQELRKWRGVFTVSTQDFNEDGHFDLFVGGHEFERAATTIYINPGDNNFRYAKKIRIPKVSGWEIVVDALYHQGKLYVLRTGGGGKKKDWETGYYRGTVLQEFDLLSYRSRIVLKKEKDEIPNWVHWVFKYSDKAGRTYIGSDELRLNSFEYQIE